MKTKDRKVLQIVLISLGFLLILLTYYLYPKMIEKEFVSEKIIEIEKETDKDTKGNYFENVEYNGFYRINNQFIVKSEKALILNEDPDIVNMTNMKVTIEMNDGRVIVITSNRGVYNKKTYDCYFQENVKATDGETTIFSENMDLLATEDLAAIYNNVVLTAEKGSLVADKVEYNFDTKYYKISMFNDEKVKVKVVK